LPSEEIIFAINVNEQKDEKVASLGRILGNRTVIYKYLNPNIITVISKSKLGLNLYLVDGVSGAIRYKSTYYTKIGLESVQICQFENVVVFSYWKNTINHANVGNNTSKHYEIVVLEMLEGHSPDVRINRFYILIIVPNYRRF
jgi:hypothetical protein